MKNKNNLRKITAAVLALISVLSVMMLPSCTNPPELSEIKPTIEVLIENSRKVNHMLFGEGLPIAYYEDKTDSEGNPVPVETEYENYYLVDFRAPYFEKDEEEKDDEEKKKGNGFFMIEQIKAEAEKVYSPDYIRPLYDMFFTGHYDSDKGGVVRANYIDGENGILKLKTYEAYIKGEMRTFDYDSIVIIKPSTADFVTFTIDSYKDGEKLNIRLTIVKSENGWRLDSPTY
jgi:hypothetical protein